MAEGIHSRAIGLVVRARGGRSAGFTLVEIALALSVLLFALLAFSRALIASSDSSATTQEISRADQAARRMLERLRAEDFADVFALYDSSSANDPEGEGTGPGANFEVAGLTASTEDKDGIVGQILFPEGNPGMLREDLDMTEIGLPRDLNGDGLVDDQDHSADYLILPVRVILAWNGQNGPARVEYKTILTNYQ